MYVIFCRLSGYNSQAVTSYTLVNFLFILLFKSILFYFVFFFSYEEGISHSSAGWLWAYYVAQADLELLEVLLP